MESNSVPPPTTMDYLIRFVQVHETFRKPEIESLAHLAAVKIEFIDYSESSPYATIRLPPPSLSTPLHQTITAVTTTSSARALLHRSISSKSIHELWGVGPDYSSLHADIRRRSAHLWPHYKSSPFKFEWDSYRGKGSRSLAEQREVIEGFAYLGFEGEIRLREGEGEVWTVFEEFGPVDSEEDEEKKGGGEMMVLKRVFLGRLVGVSERERGALSRYSLKKREYINTTSMDAELAFLTANITLAGLGKLFLDPFVGTGGLPLACAHFGASCLGGDIDGRMIRGKDAAEGRRDLRTNFGQYRLLDRWVDGFVADLTHSPLRGGKWLDGIVCDPPYGVREGLKVLGRKEGKEKMGEGVERKEAHLREGYVPPKRAYSLEAMLGDILMFAARTLVDEARVSLWMPTANDEEEELAVPEHPALELVSKCVQVFNKWSRRLLTYRRIPGVDAEERVWKRRDEGTTADELNGFRKRYFQGFRNTDQSLLSAGSVSLPHRGRDQSRPLETPVTTYDMKSLDEAKIVMKRSTESGDIANQNGIP